MGVLNVTPDSFSDGGEYLSLDKAVERAEKLIQDGAEIIDIGAESTRPEANLISSEQEWSRLEDTLRKVNEIILNRNEPELILSIDTRKREVVEKTLGFLSRIIVNDVSALEDENAGIAKLIAKRPDSYIVINHHRGIPPTKNNPKANPQIIHELIRFFSSKIELAEKLGVQTKQIILDPGLGFGKGLKENLLIIKNLEEIRKYFQLPIMIGASRKRFIKELWGDAGQDWGSLVVSALGIKAGANIIRCHEPKFYKPLKLEFDLID